MIHCSTDSPAINLKTEHIANPFMNFDFVQWFSYHIWIHLVPGSRDVNWQMLPVQAPLPLNSSMADSHCSRLFCKPWAEPEPRHGQRTRGIETKGN